MLGLQLPWKERSFPLGERIQFNTKDFADVALTLFLGALAMREVFLKLVKALGIEALAQEEPESRLSGPVGEESPSDTTE